MTPCAISLLSLLTAILGSLYPMSSPGLSLYRKPELAAPPTYTFAYRDEPVFSPLASHLANNSYPWHDKPPFREANSALLLGPAEAFLNAAATEDNDTSNKLVPRSNGTGISLSEEASQWASYVANIPCPSYKPATQRILLIGSCMFLAYTLIIADRLWPATPENHINKHECDTQDPVIDTVLTMEERAVHSAAAVEEETPTSQDIQEASSSSQNGNQVRENTLSLLREVKEEAIWLTDGIKLLSLRMNIHSSLLESQVLEEKKRSSKLLPPLQDTMIGSIWELFQDQIRIQFEEQLLRLDEATAQIQQACENLPEPQRYEAFCDDFQTELQHSVERINNLRQRVAYPYASSQTPFATMGGSASPQQLPSDLDEGLDFQPEGAQFWLSSREPCLSPISEEEGEETNQQQISTLDKPLIQPRMLETHPSPPT
ncbi:hypothetical protein BO78DRAFT_386202 [Aspergillus sclerotiicarbonarius CBS 121057]|uniref:Transmembrane protein n=1 Tax=Aspergillus sclerotiicarbonarius (strain CBS 121057 / IBT 28362) TaxID=1448318 RepID=A0A319ETJ8_ASPSB|nr:hypothetical protein BO78DRAFT_386202 [Aspergillus sclerotiicarbonarius CBS 121057]